MKYKNLEIYNTYDLIPLEDGGVTWIRVPKQIYDQIDNERGQRQLTTSTGVELRFVMHSDEVKIRMKSISPSSKVTTFHVYYGSIQAGWDGHEVDKYISCEYTDFVIKKPKNMDTLKQITQEFNMPFDPEVVRIIFDRGQFAILNVEGDISVPSENQVPQQKLLCYGSSITHGSNALNASNTWSYLLSHYLKMDLINLGMAGSCLLEKAMIDHIASTTWDIAILELGINALHFDEETIRERVNYAISTISQSHPNQPIYVLSPFYCYDDYYKTGKAQVWREIISQTISLYQYSTITYIDGLDILGNMSLLSADEVHPNIYGVQQIYEKLYQIIKGDK